MKTDIRYFITGTDTGIGKTTVSTILTVGLKAHYWKPIQTGSCSGTDSEFISKWIGKDRVYPESYIFSEPISPHLASEKEGRQIHLQKCLQDFQNLREPTIIEGAGGVLVPINSTCLMIDLIRELRVPTIVVAGTHLGTINHTLLTLHALRFNDIPVTGVVTVGASNLATKKTIENYGTTRVLGHVPVCDCFSLRWFRQAFHSLSISL